MFCTFRMAVRICIHRQVPNPGRAFPAMSVHGLLGGQGYLLEKSEYAVTSLKLNEMPKTN